MKKKHIVIIGAGPAGLYAAYLLLKNNFQVTLLDKMSGAGKKFLVAGHSGLNVTHSESLDKFLNKFSPSPSIITKAIESFPPSKIQNFYEEVLDSKLFSGSTGHVFPVDMKAGKILLNWLKLLNESADFDFCKNTALIKIQGSNSIQVSHDNKTREIVADYFIYALGGASWKKTGSSGDWADIFSAHDIHFDHFHPENCGHEIQWSKHFRDKIETAYLKNITISLGDKATRGEVMLTPYGIEGQLIYKLTHDITDCYKRDVMPNLTIDLIPDIEQGQAIKRLEALSSKTSFSTKLKKAFKFSKGHIMLTNEFRNEIDFNNSTELVKLLKSLKITLQKPRPIDEAISTSGGVALESVSDTFEFTNLSGHFCVGEMLNWSAPTGGYLLSACLASAHSASCEIIKRN